MLSCLRCNDCIESLPSALSNKPLWFRWRREHRNSNESPTASGPESLKVIRQARGERTINPRRFAGFAFFNDFELASGSSSTTSKPPEVTTLHYPSQQPQLSNGVTFANLLERARLRTTEDAAVTTPLSSLEDEEGII